MARKKKVDKRSIPFTQMNKRFSKYQFLKEIPHYFYICYPIYREEYPAYIIDNQIFFKDKRMLASDNLNKLLEAARFYSYFEDVIFDGKFVVKKRLEKPFFEVLIDDDPIPDEVVFVCDDAIRSRNYEELYRDRIAHIPDFFPGFQRESFVHVSPRLKHFIPVYYESLYRIYMKDQMRIQGMIFRPDDKPYVLNFVAVKGDYFFRRRFKDDVKSFSNETKHL